LTLRGNALTLQTAPYINRTHMLNKCPFSLPIGYPKITPYIQIFPFASKYRLLSHSIGWRVTTTRFIALSSGDSFPAVVAFNARSRTLLTNSPGISSCCGQIQEAMRQNAGCHCNLARSRAGFQVQQPHYSLYRQGHWQSSLVNRKALSPFPSNHKRHTTDSRHTDNNRQPHPC